MIRRMTWLVLIPLLPTYLLLSSSSLRAQSPGITVQFASATYTVNENAGTAILTVTLSAPATVTVTANYATSDGTAVAGTGYAATSGTVTFAPGVTSQDVSVGIIDNGNYSKQSVYFTVALSSPTNATLGTPSTTFVNVLDNDPAPVATITIPGVPDNQKNNTGGYVQVNANNDNGSKLTYEDRVTVVPAGSYGIPQKRDFDPTNINLAVADPDLLRITLSTQNLKVGGPETILLSAVSNGRAQIQIWGSAKKTPLTPLPWTVANMPTEIYVEGLLEGAALREITVGLQIKNGNKPVDLDTCTLTVTPVLTNLEITAANNAAPDIFNDPVGGWLIQSEGQTVPRPTFKENVSAQWDNVRADLRFIQNTWITNNLPLGWGADLSTPPNRKWDFAQAGVKLLDSDDGSKMPFYTPDNALTPPGGAGVATNSTNDSPRLPLSAGPNNQFLNSVLPIVIAPPTSVDVTYQFMTYATVAFFGTKDSDKAIYFLGQQAWSVRYAGQVSMAGGGGVGYTLTPFVGNADTSSIRFGDGSSVRNNSAPTNIMGPLANFGGMGWR